MLEISVKDARAGLSALLDRIEKGEEVTITRRGKQIARIVPLEGLKKVPSLKTFRKEIRISGDPMSETIVRMRKESRY